MNFLGCVVKKGRRLNFIGFQKHTNSVVAYSNPTVFIHKKI
jgi:hypothetical protein